MGIIIQKGIVDVVGKIGQSTFYKSAGLSLVKSFATHNTSSSPAQINQRNFFTEAKNAWNALSWEMVQQWNKWAWNANWKSRTYQYFIHCYLSGKGPMPVDYHHLIYKGTFTPVEISSLSSADIELIPAPGLNKFLLPRFYSYEIMDGNFDNDSITVFFAGLYSLFQLHIMNEITHAGFGVCNIYPDFNILSQVVNAPIVLSSQGNVINDLGGSTNLNIQIEYSILDWLNA